MGPLLNHRLLIIDDNPAIHEDIRKILAPPATPSPGLAEAMAAVFGDSLPQPKNDVALFELDSALQGQEGLAKVQAARASGKPYAVAFVDVRMPPGWDGIETISQLWAADSELQVILCTAYSDYSWHEIADRLGPTDRLIILKKPFDDLEVQQAAHTMTRKWSVARQLAEQRMLLDAALQERTRERDEIALLHVRVTREMSERERVEMHLRDSEERLSKAFDASPLPTAILRVFDHRCVHVNAAFLTATERRQEEMLGRTLWQIGVGASDAFCRSATESIFKGEKFTAHSCQFRTRHGEMRQGLLWLEPFQLADGPHVLAVLQDVTEQRGLEAQLRQAQKMEAVGQLAAGVAHDFNNLLQVIQGHTSYRLMNDELAPEMAQTLQEVQRAAENAAQLTRQLLAFSRKQVMSREPQPPATILDRAASMVEHALPANVALRRRGAEILPAVLVDSEQLEQVVLNLALNARDAMPDGGELTLAAELVEVTPEQARLRVEAQPGRFVRLTVADTGRGMDEATLAQIFEPFFSTKGVGEGSGMGLAMVYGVIKQHEGWIEVSTVEGCGTSFHLFLPLAEETAPQPVQPPPPALEADLRGRTILLTDDNPEVRSIARFLLESCGCRVLPAANGVEALGLWKAHRAEINLLLTDMVMPGGISGADLAERLWAEEASLPVIFSSGYSIALFRQDLEIREGVNYLPKPYLAQQLIGIVSRALGEHSRRVAQA